MRHSCRSAKRFSHGTMVAGFYRIATVAASSPCSVEPQAPEWWLRRGGATLADRRIEDAIAAGSPEKRVETLRRVDRSVPAQRRSMRRRRRSSVFDDVFCAARRADRDARARRIGATGWRRSTTRRSGLARSLASDDGDRSRGTDAERNRTGSPRRTLPRLAPTTAARIGCSPFPSVASISEAVSDRAGRAAATATSCVGCAATAARAFRTGGFGKLVERSIDDEALALCVGMRKDIPKDHFDRSSCRPPRRSSRKLVAGNPAAAAEVDRVLHGMTGNAARGQARRARLRNMPKRCVASIKSAAAPPIEPIVQAVRQSRPVRGNCHGAGGSMPPAAERVDRIMTDQRPQNRLPIVLCRLRLSWPHRRMRTSAALGRDGVPPGVGNGLCATSTAADGHRPADRSLLPDPPQAHAERGRNSRRGVASRAGILDFAARRVL